MTRLLCTSLCAAFVLSASLIHADTYVPQGPSGGEVFTFDIVGVGEVNSHPGYALHYWNHSNLATTKKFILYINDYDYQDPFRNVLKDLGQWNEFWDDSYGNIYKARSAKLIYDAHVSTAPDTTAQSIPAAVLVPRNTGIKVQENGENVTAAVEWINQLAATAGVTDDNGDGFPDFELIVVANGASGLWVRASFVQELSNLGIDKLITVDTPHKGVYPSFSVGFALGVLQFGSPLAKQINGDSIQYNQLFSWLEGAENESFLTATVDPIDTIAVAFSDGETPWDLLWGDWFEHTVFHTPTSRIELAQVETLLQQYNSDLDDFLTSVFGPDHGIALTLGNNANGTTSFVPYHSAIMADLPYNTGGADLENWVTMTDTAFLQYSVVYKTTATRYFDTKMSFLKPDGSAQDPFRLNYDPQGVAEKLTFLWPLF